jgi:L-2,4-diaminobutyrate decarboxylase
VHQPTPEEEKIAGEINVWAMERLTFRDETLPAVRGTAELPALDAAGIGPSEAWRVLRDDVLPTAVPADHPRYLAFVGGSPTVMSVVGDCAVSAAGVYAGSVLEGGRVVDAEGAAVRWLAQLAGLPDTAFGTFVSGGSIANLSALVAARHDRRGRTGRQPHVIIAGDGVHSSVGSAAEIMGCDLASDGDHDGRLDRAALTRVLERVDVEDVVAVVATAGATNTGSIDDLAGVAEICAERGLWLHVDAAYGGAALLSERTRPLFRGIEAADSITIDPHKWLFTTFDCAAVIYRDPERARRAHTQVAGYLDPVIGEAANPSDYAIHLTRRARGIPFWFSLLANGTDAYREAVDACLSLAEYTVARIAESADLEIVGTPSLSVVLFRRKGWRREQYEAWSARTRSTGLGLVTPTTYANETVLRLCFVNPLTRVSDIEWILAHL